MDTDWKETGRMDLDPVLTRDAGPERRDTCPVKGRREFVPVRTGSNCVGWNDDPDRQRGVVMSNAVDDWLKHPVEPGIVKALMRKAVDRCVLDRMDRPVALNHRIAPMAVCAGTIGAIYNRCGTFVEDGQRTTELGQDIVFPASHVISGHIYRTIASPAERVQRRSSADG